MSNSVKMDSDSKVITTRDNNENRTIKYARVPEATYYANAKIFSRGASVKHPQKIGKLCKCILDD